MLYDLCFLFFMIFLHCWRHKFQIWIMDSQNINMSCVVKKHRSEETWNGLHVCQWKITDLAMSWGDLRVVHCWSHGWHQWTNMKYTWVVSMSLFGSQQQRSHTSIFLLGFAPDLVWTKEKWGSGGHCQECSHIHWHKKWWRQRVYYNERWRHLI